VRYQSGQSARWRFVPSTAEGGLLLNAAPRSARELVDVFLGRPVDAVTEFRIVGPGTASFESEFHADWYVDVAAEAEKN